MLLVGTLVTDLLSCQLCLGHLCSIYKIAPLLACLGHAREVIHSPELQRTVFCCDECVRIIGILQRPGTLVLLQGRQLVLLVRKQVLQHTGIILFFRTRHSSLGHECGRSQSPARSGSRTSFSNPPNVFESSTRRSQGQQDR